MFATLNGGAAENAAAQMSKMRIGTGKGRADEDSVTKSSAAH